MKAEELRIGNLVKAKSPEKKEFECPVVVRIYYLEMFCHNPKRIHFEPIPLTEQWLLDFGFRKWGTYSHLWKINRQSGSILTINSKPIRKSIHGCDFEINKNPEVGIKYVHQLQNLYFALTGKELEIKQSVA